MAPDTIIPEDLEAIIADILAQEDKEKEEQNNDGDLERIYIEDLIIPDKDDDNIQKESWKIEISL